MATLATTLYVVQSRTPEGADTWVNVGPWFQDSAQAFGQIKYLAPVGVPVRVVAVASEILSPPEPVVPTVASITPNTAVVGGPDLELHVVGTGFTAASRILVNGAEEPTVYVSATELTTTMKPSLASGPWTVPVGVTGALTTVPFTFTAAA